jgi:hypothetical protein
MPERRRTAKGDPSGEAVPEEVSEYREGRRRRWSWTIGIVVALLVLKVICCLLLWFQFSAVRDAVDRIAIDEQAGAKLEEALAEIEGLEARLARQGGAGTCPTGGDTAQKSGQGSSQGTSLLAEITVSECRVEFVFQSSTPSFTIEYRSGPNFIQNPSGNPFSVQGSAYLVIEMAPASRVDLNTGTQTYTGPDVITPSGSFVREVHLEEDFEGQLNWVIGLDSQRDYSVSVGSSPPSIAVTLSG